MTKTRAASIASAFALAATLGMTASIWNPITRAYDRLEQGLQGQVVDDTAHVYDTEAITQEMGDALAEGEYKGIADAWSFPWETCRISTNHTWVFCPNGLEVEVG